jgi:hypothetical protein
VGHPVVKIEMICLELSLRFDIHHWSELSETLSDLLCRIAAMNKLEEQIMLALSIVSPEVILLKTIELLNRLAKQLDLLQSITTTIRT